MRLIITQNVTLDGAVEMLDNWFNPTEQDDELGALNSEQDARCDAMLLGRSTFEDMRGFWPNLQDDDTGISAFLDQVPKYVVSSTMDYPGWSNATVLRNDPLERVRELKQQPGQDMVLTGSIRLAHALIGADIVDEYRLFTYPVVQGRGRRLFPDDWRASLERVDARTFAGGIC